MWFGIFLGLLGLWDSFGPFIASSSPSLQAFCSSPATEPATSIRRKLGCSLRPATRAPCTAELLYIHLWKMLEVFVVFDSISFFEKLEL